MAEALFVGALTWLGASFGVRWFVAFPLGLGLWTGIAVLGLVTFGTFSFLLTGLVTAGAGLALARRAQWTRWRAPLGFTLASLVWAQLPLGRLSQDSLWFLSLGQWAHTTVSLEGGAAYFLESGPVLVVWAAAANFLGQTFLATPAFLLALSWFGAVIYWVPEGRRVWVAVLLAGILLATPMVWVGASLLSPHFPFGVLLFFFLMSPYLDSQMPPWAGPVWLVVLGFLRVETLFLAPVLGVGAVAFWGSDRGHQQWRWGAVAVSMLSALWFLRLEVWTDGALLWGQVPLAVGWGGLSALGGILALAPLKALKWVFGLGAGAVWVGALGAATVIGVPAAYWTHWYMLGGWGGLLWALTPVLFLWGPMQWEPRLAALNQMVLVSMAVGLLATPAVQVASSEALSQSWFHVLPMGVFFALAGLGLVDHVLRAEESPHFGSE